MELFENWLTRHGFRTYTIKCYVQTVQRIFKLVGEDPKDIDTFLTGEYKKGVLGTALNYYISALRTYGKFVGTDKYETIELFKIKPPIKGIFSEDEVHRFLDLPIRSQKTNPNYDSPYPQPEWSYKLFSMFWKVLAYTGMRAGECATLKVDQIDFGRHVIRLFNTKTDENREVPISPVIENELRDYVAGCRGYLFKKTTNEPIDKRTWGRDFRRRLKDMGISRPGLTPYSFRHSFITRNVTEMSLFSLQNIVGHKSADTTQHYVHYNTKAGQKAIRLDPLAQDGLKPAEQLRNLIDSIKSLNLENKPGLFYKLSESQNSLELVVAIK